MEYDSSSVIIGNRIDNGNENGGKLLWECMFTGIATADKKFYFSEIDITINIWLQVFSEGGDTHSVTLVCGVALFNVHTIWMMI